MTSDRNEPHEDAPRDPQDVPPPRPDADSPRDAESPGQAGHRSEQSGHQPEQERRLPGEEPTQRIWQDQAAEEHRPLPSFSPYEAGAANPQALHSTPQSQHYGGAMAQGPSAQQGHPGYESPAAQHGAQHNAQYGGVQYDSAQYDSPQYGAAQQGWGDHTATPYGSPAPYTYPGQPGQDVHPFYGSQQPEAPKRSIGVGGFMAGMLVAALVGGGVAVGWSALSNDGVAAPGGGIEINNPESATEVTAAAAKASPSVVTLAVSAQQGAGSGSGIVLDDQGHVLTNTHVVTLGGQTNSAEISVQAHDGSVTSAEVVGTDPLSDLAVIQLEDTSGVTPAEMGSSGELNVGDQAIAIGAPLGLEGTVTDGIVSTLNRTISVASSDAGDEESEAAPEEPEEGEEDPEGFEFFFPDQGQAPTQGYIHLNVIQTDAAINQGNSGGALVDGEGNIIGVNVAIASAGGGGQMGQTDAGSIGVGFAIPIDYAQRVADELIENGEVSHGLLGVQVRDSSAEGLEPEDAMFRQGFTNGALIDSIPDGSPAGEAGLQDGDVITQVNDTPVSDASSLTATVREHAAGDSVTVTYVRDGQSREAEVTLDGM